MLPLRRRFAPVAAAIAAAGLAGCIGDVSAPVQTLWEATIEGGPGSPGVHGSAAAVSRANHTEAGLSVFGLEPGTYRWGIREGRCASPGDLITPEPDLPAFTADGVETTEAHGVTSGRMRDGRNYLAEIRESDAGEMVACGDFTQLQ